MLNQFLKSRISIAKDLIEELDAHFDYVSVLGSYVKTKNITVSNLTNSINELENECGFVIKVYKEGRYSEYSCDDIKGLNIDTILKAITLNDFYSQDYKVAKLREEPLVKDFIREDEDTLSDQEIFSYIESVNDQMMKKSNKIMLYGARYLKRETSKIFVSKKKCLTQKYDWINVMNMVTVREDNNIKNNYSAQGEANSKLALEKFKIEADKVLKVALDMLRSKPIVPGKYTIITDPSISGLIAHEAFGHGVEMDMFVKNRAKAKDYMNKKVASSLVNMFDGAAACISAASYFFDDDGILAHNTQIIKDGILVSGISDSLSALQLGSEPTGNGRRESYQRKVYARMTNTFFGPGTDKLEDMIASVKHGYYLCQTNNGMEDPKNWQIQCTASYGYEIINGKITDNIVAPVVISGYVIDLLNSISMVSQEVTVHGSGMCGKGHKEYVYVSDGGPYLKAEAKLG